MGWRFRKSFGKTFRINVSKSGIGYSVGTKGYRITKTAKGTTRETISVPGTGISYVTETSNKETNAIATTSAPVKYKSIPYKIACIILTIVLIIGIPMAIRDSYEQSQKILYQHEITYVGRDFYETGTANVYLGLELILENKSNTTNSYSFSCWYSENKNSAKILYGEITVIVVAKEKKNVTVKLYPTENYEYPLQGGPYYLYSSEMIIEKV